MLLSIGAFVGKPMGIPGEKAPFVEDGVSFLYRVNDGERPTLPETVLVIGGGDVAMDACRVAKRLPGVKQVKVIYRRDFEAMPARREELHGAIEEGIEVMPLPGQANAVELPLLGQVAAGEPIEAISQPETISPNCRIRQAR